MKKLIFLFGFMFCMSFGASAQSYVSVDDAIGNLKEFVAKVDSKASVVAFTSSSDLTRRVRVASAKGLIDAIAQNGNSASTVNKYFIGLNLDSRLGAGYTAKQVDFFESLLTE